MIVKVAPNIIDALKKDTDYKYFKELAESEKCVDWIAFAEKLYRKSHAASTVNAYCKGAYYFRDFVKQKYDKTLCEMLAEFASCIEQTKNGDHVKKILAVIDAFVAATDSNGMAAKTIENYVVGVRRLLKFQLDLKIAKEDFKDTVTMPTKIEIQDEVPSDAQIREILNHCNPRMRGLLLTMIDSGMSIGDTLSRKVSDFHFDESPVRITLVRGKTKVQHESFVGEGTAKLIEQLIKVQKKKPNDYVFVRVLSCRSPPNTRREFIKALKRANLDSKIEGHKWHRFHPHVFRKRWFSKALNAVDAYIAHAMLGRRQYMAQYLRKSLSERQELYRKISKFVSVFETQASKEQVAKEVSALLGAPIDEQKLLALKALMNEFASLGDRDLEKLKKTILGGKGRKK